jgi:N12 class adenine-specific DNA methylase
VAVGSLGESGAVAPFRPTVDEDRLPPSGARGRAQTNLAVIRLLEQLHEQDRGATADEQELLSRWSGWGACAELFDEARDEWAQERRELHALVGEDGFAAARRTTLNAHYTHPAIAAAMWSVAQAFGAARGEAIEPGCGAGVFIGLAPEAVRMVGVELDSTTAEIAEMLYPDAQIINRSFGDRMRGLRPDTFDLAIGNVPFAKVALYDPEHNRGGHSLHNHFILKSLALTKPGGIAVLLTSRFTLDSANPSARREISRLGDLVGAFRLPSGAHQRVAGTQAVTDLIVLRRRPAGTETADDRWVRTQLIDVEGEPVRINSYLAQHPERILGDLKLARGLYGNDELTVQGDARAAAIAEQIQSWAAATAPTVLADGRAIADVAADPHAGPLVDVNRVAEIEAPQGLWDGHLLALASGDFAVVRDGLQVPFETPRTVRAELRALLGLRDRAKQLLTAEAESFEDTPAIASSRDGLRRAYEDYAERWGAINRFTLRRTGRVDPQTAQERTARVTPPAVRLIRGDPFAPLVVSLEVFDEQTRTATPATLLRERVVAPRAPVLGADSPEDALAVCLDTYGHVDVEAIAELLGDTTDGARTQLGELIYETPDGQLLTAAEYLSGNVREKLDAARQAAVEDPALSVNVDALLGVLPAELGAEEVQPQMGAAWIGEHDHQEFLREILDDPRLRVERSGGGVWGVQGNNASIAARSEWGTSRMAAPAIAKALLEQRVVQVTDETDEGRRVVNPVETEAAQEKAEAIKERFAEWCWEDPERARRLLGEYNRRFNSIVLRDYAADGGRLSLPGLVRSFAPMPHQRAAVARMLSEPAVGLFHQVGAGKTAEMIIGAAELRRLGMIRKPVVVVPNHMLEQFTREWLQLYPHARILATSSEDLAGDKRRQFVARAASNDWDAVLITRSAFERIPVSPETQTRYLEREVEQLRGALQGAKGREGHSLTVKRLEKMVLAREQKLKKQTDAIKDVGIAFEQTGIDYVIVDEAHGYKNLETVSNIRDAQIEGSKRATDLHMKLEWLRSRHGPRVATLATATPIANSITEAHVMQRYLRPDLLRAAGVEHFDEWAATFGQTVTEIEMAPTGGGNYRMNTRFARFQNVPEMLRMWHVFADVKTAEDLQLPTPALKPAPGADAAAPAGPKTVVIAAGPEITAYLEHLADRAEKVRGRQVDPSEDNMLLISGDGRRAALDMRLVRGERTAGECKLERAAETIAGIWREHRDASYLDVDSGEPSPIRGALQMVFCDVSTPAGDGWNAYDELRALLAAQGVPEQQVRFVHEARHDSEKGRLFASCRAGHVAVLLGSTEKMGVGTNIQARAIALHHLDCPWRPADIEQREGRILRQGNQNEQVEIYRYVVERSFDAYSWQTVERKAKFIAQVTRGRLDVRSIDDVGDQALSFTEVKALASGDPLILEQARLGNDVTRLERLNRAWHRNREQLRYTLVSAAEREKARAADVVAIERAIAQRVDTRGDRFAFTIGAVTHTERTAAAQALTHRGQTTPLSRSARLGQLGGFQIIGKVRSDYENGGREVVLEIDGIPCEPAHATLKHLAESPLTLVRQLEYRLADLEDRRGRTIVRQQEAAQEGVRARDGLERPFKHGDELGALRTELAAVIEQMQHAAIEHAADPPPEGEGTPAPDEIAPTTQADRRRSRGQSRKDRGESDLRPSRSLARQRPPMVAPPDAHNYPPPGSGIEF